MCSTFNSNEKRFEIFDYSLVKHIQITLSQCITTQNHKTSDQIECNIIFIIIIIKSIKCNKIRFSTSQMCLLNSKKYQLFASVVVLYFQKRQRKVSCGFFFLTRKNMGEQQYFCANRKCKTNFREHFLVRNADFISLLTISTY